MPDQAVDHGPLTPDAPDLPVRGLSAAQRAAFAAWREGWLATERDRDGTTLREARIDLDRRLAVLRRQHEAMRTAVEAGPPSSGGGLVAHRDERTGRQLVALLAACCDGPVTLAGNGADAVGLAVLQQPALVVVDAPLPMMTAADVVEDVRRHVADVAVVACADGVDPAELERAGAVATYRRGARLQDVVGLVLGAIGAAGREGASPDRRS